MKNLIIIFFLLLSCTIFSQEEKKILVGAYFSPEASYRTLKAGNESDPIQEMIIDQREKIEKFGFGFETGLSFEYRIKWFCSVQIGMGFAQKTTKYQDLTAVYPSGSPYPALIRSRDQYYYLTIPLNFRFSFMKGWVRPFASIGLGTNIYIGRKHVAYMEYQDGSSQKNKSEIYSDEIEYFPVNLQGIFSLGCDFDLKPGITIRIEPVFRQSFNSITHLELIRGYFYSIGCMIGLHYRLGK